MTKKDTSDINIDIQIGMPKIVEVLHINKFENGKCTGFNVKSIVAVNVEATNIEDVADASQPTAEIEQLLSGYEIKLQKKDSLLWENVASVKLNKTEIVDAIIDSNGKKQTFNLEIPVELINAGTHIFRVDLNGNASESVEYTIDKLENDIEYESGTLNNVQHEYAEIVRYKHISGNKAGGAICYESDIFGNKLEGSDNLKITRNADGSFDVQGIKLSKKNQPFYVTIEHTEDEIYKRGLQIFPFYVNKIELNGEIQVRDVKKDGIFYHFFKTDNMYVEVTAGYKDLKQQEAEAIDFALTAIIDSDNTKTLNLEVVKAEKKYNKNNATATYLYTISRESSKILKTNEIYKIQAIADYTALADFEYFVPYSITFDNVKVLANELKITNYSSELNAEYSKEQRHFQFDITGNNIDAFDIVYNIEAKDSTIIDIDNEGNYKTLKAGETSIVITASDASGYDIYNSTSVEIPVIITSPLNTDYTLNGMSRDAFIRCAETVIAEDTGKTERWYAHEITLCFDENNLYTGLCYSTDSGKTWTKSDSREFVISESMPTDYEFYFYNEEADIVSNRVKSNEILQAIAVDTTSPSWNTELLVSEKPSIHSTDSISYFSSQVTLTGSTDNNKLIDSGSGIAKAYVQYDNSGKWEEIAGTEVNSRYSSSYQITLTDNRKYGKIKLKVVDYLGHESEIAEYQKMVCVDSVMPLVTAVPIDNSGSITNYNGEWTNNQLRYEISLINDKQVSGIYKYEYTFIPRGSDILLEDAEWKEINNEDLQIVFGSALDNEQKILKGNMIYPDTHISREPINSIETYSKLNGTLYFRAESYAALRTSNVDSAKYSSQIRIWQEDLKTAIVKADNKPSDKTGWYNMKTQSVNISFEYPQYDAANYAPLVGIVYEITTLTENPKETRTYKKQFYKGIIDETTGKIVETSDYNKAEARTSLTEEGTIHINTDGITTLKVYTEDAAGNKSDITIFEIKADFNAPENILAKADGEALKVHLNKDENITYGKFSQTSVQVSASAEYGISQKQNFYMTLVKKNGEKAELLNSNAKNFLNIEPCTRGLIYLCAVDSAGNKTEAWTDGIVVDNLAPKGNNQQKIFITAKGANDAGFYNEDVQISFNVADAPENDNYAGLKSVSYTVGKDGQSTQADIIAYYNSSGSLTENQIVNSHKFETDNIVINAVDNESNAAYITVTATDNAGNVSSTTQEFMIDVTKPHIEVLFDNNNASNNSYYNVKRTAQINITELNFSPSKVNFIIYKNGKEDHTLIPSQTSWTNSDNNLHTTYITFDEDGDYSFELQCTDLAENESEREFIEVFTIDKTKPVVEITYDNNNASKEKYYNQARTATITVIEHNFDEKDFEMVITPYADLGNWTHHEDMHKIDVKFDKEEHYTYSVDYTDLAGNRMDMFSSQEFFIDRNAPDIQISGVENHSANAGEVAPIVTVSDTNFDKASVKIALRNSKGEQILLNETSTQNAQGYSYKLDNVNGQPDEIYTLSVNAVDMAGNENEQSVLFSLNRNGSVYDLSQISEIVDKKYIQYKDMRDLQICEMNVNAIEEFKMYITRNGEMITALQKDTIPKKSDENTIYYTIQENGNDEIGYEYNYTISKEAFKQEGIYNIIFYSKDKAGNEVNNTLAQKEAQLTFIVDNTAPNVVVEGIEDGGFYIEETKDINVYASDNFKLKEVYFNLIDEDGNIVQSYDYMKLAKEEGEIVTITLPGSDKKQSLQYYAIDAAGNDITNLSEEAFAKGFLISINDWLQYINNKRTLSISAAAGVCVLITGMGVILRRKKRIL